MYFTVFLYKTDVRLSFADHSPNFLSCGAVIVNEEFAASESHISGKRPQSTDFVEVFIKLQDKKCFRNQILIAFTAVSILKLS